MKMVVITYSGGDPVRVSSLLDEVGVPGHTRFSGGHGHGLSGPREGNRAWPGEVAMFYTVIKDHLAADLMQRLERTTLPPGERLHAAVLSVEAFI
jgi:hypothetical protein